MSQQREWRQVKGTEWRLWRNDDGTYPYDQATLAVLMDIRAELQALNRVMQCSNVGRGFSALAKIARRDEKAFKRRVDDAVRKRLGRKHGK